MPSKPYPLAAVLGVSTGCNLGMFNEVHRLIEQLLDSPVFTHSLANESIWDAARVKLFAQHPQLEKYDKASARLAFENVPENALEARCTKYIADVAAKLGADAYMIA